jgi:hypothetical protein
MALSKEDCYAISGKYCACIDFQPTDHLRRGFHTSQLIEYTLEPNPEAEEDKNAPPQRLAIAFSTADVVILGWALDRLADKLQENDLSAVRARPKRYGELERLKPYVTSIVITPVEEG